MLALTSPTSSGRSVGMVRSRTQATEFSVFFYKIAINNPYCIWIRGQTGRMVSPLYPNKANTPGYGQLYIFYSAEETTKQNGNQ
jgi:hypothetical protein